MRRKSPYETYVVARSGWHTRYSAPKNISVNPNASHRSGAPPRRRRVVVASEPRGDREGRVRQRGDEEAAREEQVDAAALHRKARGRQYGDEQAGQGHRRLQDEAELGEVVARAKRGMGDEQSQAGSEQSCEQDLSPKPALLFALSG